MGRHENELAHQQSPKLMTRDAQAKTDIASPASALPAPNAAGGGASADAEHGIGGVPVWFRAGDELTAKDFDVRDEVHPELAGPQADSAISGEQQHRGGADAVPFYLAENLAQTNTTAAKIDAAEIPSSQRSDLPRTEHVVDDAQFANRPIAMGLRGADDTRPKDDFKRQQELTKKDAAVADVGTDRSSWRMAEREPKGDFKKQDLSKQQVAGAGIAGAAGGAYMAQRDFAKDDFKQQEFKKDDFKQQDLSKQQAAGAGIAGAAGGAYMAQRDFAKDDFKQQDLTKDEFKQQALLAGAAIGGMGGAYPSQLATGTNTFDERPVGQKASGEQDASANFGAAPAGWSAGPPRFGFMRKGEGLNRDRLARGFHSGAAAARTPEQVLSKPPTRHWGYEPALVQQPDIDQAPDFKRKFRGQTRRIRRNRRAIGWVIPSYEAEKKEVGGVAWAIPIDDSATSTAAPAVSSMDGGAAVAPVASGEPAATATHKKKKSKMGKLLKRFTGIFKSHKHSDKKQLPSQQQQQALAEGGATPTVSRRAAIEVRPQRRIAARGIPKADVTNVPQRVMFGRVNEVNPPLAPIVEKKVHVDIDPGMPITASKVEIASAGGTGPALKREIKHEVVSVANMPLFRQAPAVDDDKTAPALKQTIAAEDIAQREDDVMHPNPAAAEELPPAQRLKIHPETAPPALPSHEARTG